MIMMINQRTVTLISLAALVSLALVGIVCQAKEASISQQQQQPHSQSLASKLIPQTKARTARSLSDMFEKVRSKIFGSRKQASAASSNTNSQIQPAASVNVAQRQPWGDLSSFNQQYSPYSTLSGSNYQWPSAASAGNQFMGQQYNPMSGFSQSSVGASSGYPMLGAQAQGASSIISGLDGSVQQQQQQPNVAANSNSNSASNGGGLLSSASHLIAQYLSPSGGASSGSSASQMAAGAQPSQQVGAGQQQQNAALMSPQQQQQQSQYQEFASILDSMVAQTGSSPQRQPSGMSQYGMAPSGQQAQQVAYQQATGSAGASMMAGSPMVGDNDMSGSSNIQSYLPAASPQQASQKSSMVGLAEQLAPGAQFNKLVSFPFSLSNNDDPSKEGRYKLHIPFLNQHVKRSDQTSSSAIAAAKQQQQQQQQLQQQYLNSYYQQLQQQQQQQQYAPVSGNQQMMAQSSQVVPTVVSPQLSAHSSASGIQSSSGAVPSSSISSSSVSSSSSASAVSSSAPVAQSNSAVPAQQSPSSSSMLSSVSNNNPSVSSSAISGQTNSRPAWSVADLQSSASSSKLIPMPSSASSSVDSAASSQS